MHVLVEATRLALMDALCFLGDPSHVTLPMETLLHKMYSQRRAQHINMGRFVFLCESVGASMYQ